MRTIFVLLLLLAIPWVVFSQPIDTSSLEARRLRLYAVSFGVRGGVGQSSVSFRPYQQGQSGRAFDVGVFVRLRGDMPLAMQVEFGYMRTGYTTREFTARNGMPEDWLGRDLQVTQHWATLPVMGDFAYSIGWFGFRVFGGAMVDYLLGETLQAEGRRLAQKLYEGLYHRLGVGVLGGGGLGVVLPIGSIMLEYRGFYRFTDLYRRDRTPMQEEPRQGLRGQMLSLSYYYTLELGR